MISAANVAKSPENITGITGRTNHPSQSPAPVKDEMINRASTEMSKTAQKVDPTPDELMENVVEAGSQDVSNIDTAHDFNIARVMELLSDPILQEDIPDE